MIRLNSLAFTVLAATASGLAWADQNPLPPTLANAPSDAWVPVMVLEGGSAPVLGMAQLSDIEDGYPYKVGLFEVVGSTPIADSLKLTATVGSVNLKPLCSNAISAAQIACDPVVGVLGARGGDTASQISLGAQYQLGPVQLGADVFSGDRAFTRFNPYLSLPSDPALTLINSPKQVGVGVRGLLDSRAGTFGLQVQLAKSAYELDTPLRPEFRSDFNEGKLTFDWLKGSFASSVSTRVMETPGNVWGGIDLGLSWRTPWQGKLTLGARNVVTSGKPPTYLDPKRAPDAVDQERVPYVRYEQDL
jgi:hypothetical protein